MVFKFGTGWLGWSPEQTLDTPMPQLFLALEGKIDFLKKTNPFGGGEKPPEKTPEQEADAKAKLSRFHIVKAAAIKKAQEKAKA